MTEPACTPSHFTQFDDTLAYPALHRSHFVRRRHGPRSLTGTLCPNSVLPDGRRVDDVLGLGFALITALPLTSAQHLLAEERGCTPYFAAPGPELARWLRRGHPVAALVRPDRTVMATSRSVAQLLTQVPRYHPAVHGQHAVGENSVRVTQDKP